MTDTIDAITADRALKARHRTMWALEAGLPLIAIDNLPGARPLETTPLPRACVLLFGQEGSGLTAEAHDAADGVLSIAQFGSTRSINAGVAAGIAMHAWVRQHVR